MPSQALEDALERVKKSLERAKEIIDDDPGPLQDPEKTKVADELSDVEGEIDTIYSIAPPSLSPQNAGTVIGTYDPSTLPEYASDCETLGQQAYTNVTGPSPDDDYIGDRLKTIEHLLPDYRSEAGIA